MIVLVVLKKIFIDYWKITYPAIFLIILAFYLRSCWTSHKAKLTQQQIVEAQQAIAKGERDKMVEVLAKSDADEAVADAKAEDAPAIAAVAIEESKKKSEVMTNQELADELNRRAVP